MMARTMSLAEMPAGCDGTVCKLTGGQNFVRRIEAMGIRLGIKLRKTSSQYLRGPVTVRTGNLQIALGFGMASKVVVEVEGGGQSSA